MGKIQKFVCTQIFLSYSVILICLAISANSDGLAASSSASILGEMDVSSIQLPILGHRYEDSETGHSHLEFSNITKSDAERKLDDGAENRSRTSGDVVKKRSKRFIYFNTDATIDFVECLSFLLTIPFTIILPPMSNLFNSWKYTKRSARSLREEDEVGVVVDDSPVIQPYLDRVNSYFELIKIPESSCQQRAICEFSSAPDKYFPVSDLILNQVRDPALTSFFYDEQKPSNNGTQSLFQLLSLAADKGLADGFAECEKSFANRCPYSVDQRLNLPLLKYWKSLEGLLNLKFQDEF